MQFAIGRSGRIAALVFGYPLRSPPLPRRANKILWVARRPTSSANAMLIDAQRMIGGRNVGDVVRRTVAGGPGPSIVNLPHAGCWRLTLRWPGSRDTLDLGYTSH
jgi:hypothetical protein